MRVSVLEPWGALYEGNADQVVLPGEDGDLAVLDFHHPFMHRLRKGVIELKSRQPLQLAILDGVARMSGNELVILVETERARKGKVSDTFRPKSV